MLLDILEAQGPVDPDVCVELAVLLALLQVEGVATVAPLLVECHD